MTVAKNLVQDMATIVAVNRERMEAELAAQRVAEVERAQPAPAVPLIDRQKIERKVEDIVKTGFNGAIQNYVSVFNNESFGRLIPDRWYLGRLIETGTSNLIYTDLAELTLFLRSGAEVGLDDGESIEEKIAMAEAIYDFGFTLGVTLSSSRQPTVTVCAVLPKS